MGSNIHAYIEVKRYDHWHLWAILHLDRRYDAYGLMGADRGGEVLFESRGYPVDMSHITNMQINNDHNGAHHKSWLNHDELMTVRDKLEAPWDELTAIILMMEALGLDTQDCRLIFWFDN